MQITQIKNFILPINIYIFATYSKCSHAEKQEDTVHLHRLDMNSNF